MALIAILFVWDNIDTQTRDRLDELCNCESRVAIEAITSKVFGKKAIKRFCCLQTVFAVDFRF